MILAIFMAVSCWSCSRTPWGTEPAAHHAGPVPEDGNQAGSPRTAEQRFDPERLHAARAVFFVMIQYFFRKTKAFAEPSGKAHST